MTVQGPPNLATSSDKQPLNSEQKQWSQQEEILLQVKCKFYLIFYWFQLDVIPKIEKTTIRWSSVLLIYIYGTPDSEPFQHQIWLGVSQSSRHKDQMLYICNLLQTAITVGKYCGMTESYLNNQPILSDVCRANSKPLLFIVKILLKTQMIKSYLNIANPLWCMHHYDVCTISNCISCTFLYLTEAWINVRRRRTIYIICAIYMYYIYYIFLSISADPSRSVQR